MIKNTKTKNTGEKKTVKQLTVKSSADYIWYADSLDNLDKPEQIKLIDLPKKVGQDFTYSDTLTFSAKQPDKFNLSTFKDCTEYFNALAPYVSSSLILCNMGQAGHGVFAGKDFAPAECILLYGGDIIISSENNSAYCLGFTKENDITIDASKTGNLARFLQHLLDNTLHTKSFASSINHDFQCNNLICHNKLSKANVAFANLVPMAMLVNGLPCMVLWNNKPIKKGQQLGFSYGLKYWLVLGKTPSLFDLRGRVIPVTDYDYQEILNDKITNKFTQLHKLEKEKAKQQSEKRNEINLINTTVDFFQKKPLANWKKYPPIKLTEKYIGHNVWYFTMPKEQKSLTNNFHEKLKDQKFTVNLTNAKSDQPSLIVDLTTSPTFGN